MRTTGEVIREQLKKKQITQTDFAQRLGIKPSSVNQWLTGKTRVDQDHLVTVAEILGITTDELLGRRNFQSVAGEMVALPYVPGRASVQFANCLPQTDRTFPVLQQWIDPESTYMVIEVEGHAMEKEIRAGSTVLAEYISNTQLAFESGGIYAIQFQGRLVVRRIRENDLRVKGILTLHSDNPDYSSIIVKDEELECAWRILSILHQPVR